MCAFICAFGFSWQLFWHWNISKNVKKEIYYWFFFLIYCIIKINWKSSFERRKNFTYTYLCTYMCVSSDSWCWMAWIWSGMWEMSVNTIHSLCMKSPYVHISHRIQRKSQSIIKMKKDEEEEFFLRKLYKKRKAQWEEAWARAAAAGETTQR